MCDQYDMQFDMPVVSHTDNRPLYERAPLFISDGELRTIQVERQVPIALFRVQSNPRCTLAVYPLHVDTDP